MGVAPHIVWRSAQGESVVAIAAVIGSGASTVRRLQHFEAAGLARLDDAARGPPTYSAEVVGAVVAAALTDPQTLGLPFRYWTDDRLVTHLNQMVGVPIKRSRIHEVLMAEGLRWCQ